MEDELKEGHDDELRGLDLADDGAEGDEHGGDAKESVHQRVDVQVNIMPVSYTHLRAHETRRHL
eukprot:9654259-Prorocentrum_lima.AAC.1